MNHDYWFHDIKALGLAFFSATAGFIEAGKMTVQTVHFEVKEVLNVNVKNIYSFDTVSWLDYKNLPKLSSKTGLSCCLIQEGIKFYREADINNNFKIEKFFGIKGGLIIILFTRSGLYYLKYTNSSNGVNKKMLQIGLSFVSGILYTDQFFKSTFRNTMGYLDYKKVAKHCLFFAPVVGLAAITLNNLSNKTVFFNKPK